MLAACRRVLPLGVMALGLVGCPARERGRIDDTRPLEVLVANDAETLDPRYATDAVGMRVTRLVHAGLTRLDPDTLAPLPYLARKLTWTSRETLRVELRDDVHFHSGAVLTARDVVATLRALTAPSVASRHARVVDAIGPIDVESDRVFYIHLARPHATLLTDLEVPILRADEAMGPPRPDGDLDGLGPFVVETRAPGAITLRPATGSATNKPSHAVVIRTVHDENARALRVHAGRADVVVNGFSQTLVPALETAPGIRVNAREGANLTYAVMRVDSGPLSDVRVRRAIVMAIDRARIKDTLLAGHASVAETLLPPSHWAYSRVLGLPFDPRAARDALTNAHAGRLALTMLTSTDRLRMTIARVIAQSLSDVGIDLELIPLELGTMLGRLGAADFDLALLQLPELTEPNVLRVFLHSASVPPEGANRGRVRDPVLDALLDRGDRETSPEARRTIYAALERRVRDEAWLVPLWHEDQISVVSARAKAFRPSAEGRWLTLADIP